AKEVSDKKRSEFKGAEAVARSPRLAAVIEALAGGSFSPGDPSRYKELAHALLAYDPFMVAADFDAYWDAQRNVDQLWRSPSAWWRAAILNTARMAWFSSDRTIREYAEEIWRVRAD